MRTIDPEKPFTEDEKGWLRQRDRGAEVEANEARFAPDSEEWDEPEKAPAPDEYERWTAAELKAEATDRKIDIAGMTKKSQIVEALRADDRENAE